MEEKLREMEEQMRASEAGGAKAKGGAEEELAPEMPSGGCVGCQQSTVHAGVRGLTALIGCGTEACV